MVKLKKELAEKLKTLPSNNIIGGQIVDIKLSEETTDFRDWIPVYFVENFDTLPNLFGLDTEDIIDVRLHKF